MEAWYALRPHFITPKTSEGPWESLRGGVPLGRRKIWEAGVILVFQFSSGYDLQHTRQHAVSAEGFPWERHP